MRSYKPNEINKAIKSIIEQGELYIRPKDIAKRCDLDVRAVGHYLSSETDLKRIQIGSSFYKLDGDIIE